MTAGFERMKRQQQNGQGGSQPNPERPDASLPSTQDSILSAIEAQNDRLDEVTRQVSLLAERQREMASRLASTTPASAATPSGSWTIEGLGEELTQIGMTLPVLASAIDGEAITAAASSLTSAASRITETTSWNSDQATKFVEAYRKALNQAGRSINATRDEALWAITRSAEGAADAATARVDERHEELHAVVQSAERTTEVAERLTKALGWGAAGRMALVALPVAVVALMAVMTVSAVVGGVRWGLSMDWALWLDIVAGAGLLALVVGAGYGLWRLSVWVLDALEQASR